MNAEPIQNNRISPYGISVAHPYFFIFRNADSSALGKQYIANSYLRDLYSKKTGSPDVINHKRSMNGDGRRSRFERRQSPRRAIFLYPVKKTDDQKILSSVLGAIDLRAEINSEGVGFLINLEMRSHTA